MAKEWLNIFLRFSGISFSLKKKVADSTKFHQVLPYALLLLVVEVVFIVLSFPMYLLFSPKKLQEKGWIIPQRVTANESMNSYTLRRAISIGTVVGALGVYLIKVLVVAVASLFVLGGNVLLAASENWGFTSTTDYTYDDTLIEFVDGSAQLRLLQGQISDAVIDSLEFDADTAVDASVLLVSGDIYAIAYEGAGGDGFISTVEINSAGQITDAVIDTYEFDAGDGGTPDILHISGNVYAIVYQGAGNDGFISTINIANNGTITRSIIDTLEYDQTFGSEAKIIRLSGNIYAIAYRGGGTDGFLTTVEIETDGMITDAVIDSWEYDTNQGKTPDIVSISGDIYAVAYGGNGDDGFVSTVTISSAGSITKSFIDTLEFDTVRGLESDIFLVDGDVYGIAYSGNGTDGYAITVDIDANGIIEDTVVDSWEFDESKGATPSIQKITDNIYAVAYEGNGADGFASTIEITNSGVVTTSTLDNLEFDTTEATDTTLTAMSGDIYIIAYTDTGSDGQLVTVDIGTEYSKALPTITPTSSLTPELVVSWSSFTETATKNGGEIYYQLSDDDGANWQYWDGASWSVAGASDYNTADTVNTNIATFSVANGKIMWKAFLSSDGTQQVIIDAIDIGYSGGDAPDVTTITPAQSTTTVGMVEIDYTLQENDSDPSSLVLYEYSLTGAFVGEEATMTASTTHANHDGISGLSTSPSGTVHTFVWDAATDVGAIYDDSVYVRMQANDGASSGGATTSAAFIVDTALPVISNLTASQSASSMDVNIRYDLADNTTSSLTVAIDISEDGGATWTVTSTAVSGDIGAGITAGTMKSITWDTATDFVNQEQSDIRVRLQATDAYGNESGWQESADFTLDSLAPTGLASFEKFTGSASQVTLRWAGSVADGNFSHYEIWHGPNQSDVQGRIGSAIEWDDSNDANLSVVATTQTIITGLSIEGDYYTKIWAVDTYGNETTVDHINVYEAPVPDPTPTVSQPTGGGAGKTTYVKDVTPPEQPVINTITSPTADTSIKLSGLAEPRSKIDLYDNGVKIMQLRSLTQDSGVFTQDILLEEGTHILTVRALDSANNASATSAPMTVVIDRTAPEPPVVLSPTIDEFVGTTPVISGTAEPQAVIYLAVQEDIFDISADEAGTWALSIPESYAFTLGTTETITLWVRDEAGNQSQNITHDITIVAEEIDAEEISVVIEEEVAPSVATSDQVPVAVVTPPVVAPTPLVMLDQTPIIIPEVFEEPIIPESAPAVTPELVEAVEEPTLPVPEVVAVQPSQKENTFAFSGRALPNQDVIVYINSPQTLVYRTMSDDAGIWHIRHSQESIELAPGEHSIFAVSIDPITNVRTSISTLQRFSVRKNLWVSAYNHLDLSTTVVTTIILFIALLFVSRVRQQAIT